MKSASKQTPVVINNSVHQELLDNLAIKLTQTRALLLVGSDVDFSSYHPSVQQDFFGATLECVEDMSLIMPELFREKEPE